MQDNFDVHKWNKERYLNEANESKPKDEFDKAEDKLYKAVTGEEPNYTKPSKNKMREPVKEEANDDKYEAWQSFFNDYYNDNQDSSKSINEEPMKFIEWMRNNYLPPIK